MTTRQAGIAAICFAIAFASSLAMQFQYVAESFLRADDTIYLTKALLGQPDIVRTAPIPHMLISLLAAAQSLVLIKLVWLSFFAGCAALIALIFAQYVDGVALPVALGLAIGTLPISGDQIIFVSGSHATVALLPILAALLLFIRISTSHGRRFVVGSLGVICLLHCAAFSSPTAFLAPAAFPIWLLVLWSSTAPAERRGSDLLVAFGLCGALTGAAYIGAGLGEYHYSGIVGWTQLSASLIFRNLQFALRHAGSFVLFSSSPMFEFYLLCAAVLVAFVVWSIWSPPRSAEPARPRTARENGLSMLALNTIVVAALAFGPSSIVTAISERYLAIPIISGWIFAVAVWLRRVGPSQRWQSILVLAVFCLLAGLNMLRTRQQNDERQNRFFRVHRSIASIVQSEGRKWPKNAQILMLTFNPNASPTYGYNHWSTWYLRYIAGKPGILAIVGHPASISREPFIETYRDHSPEFWRVVAGRSQRIRMIGFERHRPIFAYQQNRKGAFERLDLVAFVGDQRTKLVGRGQSYTNAANQSDLLRICSTQPASRIFIWQPRHVKPQMTRSTLCSTETFRWLPQ